MVSKRCPSPTSTWWIRSSVTMICASTSIRYQDRCGQVEEKTVHIMWEICWTGYKELNDIGCMRAFHRGNPKIGKWSEPVFKQVSWVCTWPWRLIFSQRSKCFIFLTTPTFFWIGWRNAIVTHSLTHTLCDIWLPYIFILADSSLPYYHMLNSSQ